jgi:uncharacterized protein YcbX
MKVSIGILPLNTPIISQMYFVKILSRVIHRIYKLKKFLVDEKPIALLFIFLGLLVLWCLISFIGRSTRKSLQISEIWVYPVKGCRGQRVQTAMVTPRGLMHDRTFAVVNTTTGRVVTQRQEPRLALVCCTVQGLDSLDMSYAGDVVLDEAMMEHITDKRLFTVSHSHPEDEVDPRLEGEADVNAALDAALEEELALLDDLSNGKDLAGGRVFLNALNVPAMEGLLLNYLSKLHEDPFHGIRTIEEKEREALLAARDAALERRRARAAGEQPTVSKHAHLSRITANRPSFWRAPLDLGGSVGSTPLSSPARDNSSGTKSNPNPSFSRRSTTPFSPSTRRVLVWDEEIECLDCGDFAALWLRAVFPESGGAYRLVRMKEDHVRHTPLHALGGELENDSPEEVRRKKSSPFGVATMPDARPLLLTNRASLEALNNKLVRHSAAGGSKTGSMEMDRFRPNIVVEGAPAFAEDDWSSVTFASMPSITFFAQPCRRCKVPTNDQSSGSFDADAEPNTTLKTFHQGAHLGLIDPKAQREVSSALFAMMLSFLLLCI